MNEKVNEIRKSFELLLSERRIEYIIEDGYFRFNISSSKALWEDDVKCYDSLMLIYGRFPNEVSDEETAFKMISDMNAHLRFGGAFLSKDSHPVYRLDVRLYDVFDMKRRMMDSFKIHTQVMSRYYSELVKL